MKITGIDRPPDLDPTPDAYTGINHLLCRFGGRAAGRRGRHNSVSLTGGDRPRSANLVAVFHDRPGFLPNLTASSKKRLSSNYGRLRAFNFDLAARIPTDTFVMGFGLIFFWTAAPGLLVMTTQHLGMA